MRIFFALLTLVVGLLLVFGGYRAARLIIPLWGFVAGLSLGGAVISDMANTPFLGTVLGVFIGLVMGLVFAVFAYLFYSVAVVVLAGSLGYWLGSGFIVWLGLNEGLLSTLVGIALGIVVGLWAMMLNAPKYVLIALTSIAGAVTSIGGVLLLFNKIPLDNFSYAAAHASVSNSFWWTAIAVILAAVGIVTQVRASDAYEFEKWEVATGSGSHHTTTPHTPGLR